MLFHLHYMPSHFEYNRVHGCIARDMNSFFFYFWLNCSFVYHYHSMSYLQVDFAIFTHTKWDVVNQCNEECFFYEILKVLVVCMPIWNHFCKVRLSDQMRKKTHLFTRLECNRIEVDQYSYIDWKVFIYSIISSVVQIEGPYKFPFCQHVNNKITLYKYYLFDKAKHKQKLVSGNSWTENAKKEKQFVFTLAINLQLMTETRKYFVINCILSQYFFFYFCKIF